MILCFLVRRRYRLAQQSALAAALLTVATVDASAHAFPRPYDLPLTLSHWLIGAGATVALTFVAAAGLMWRPEHGRGRALALPRQATDAFVIALQSVSITIFVLLVGAGLFGDQGDWDSNILPVAIWVVWWVGMSFICALVGDIWSLVNPWAATGLILRRMRGSRPPRFVLPKWVDTWPAVLLFIVFAWVELVWPSNAVPVRLACAILLYSALTFTGMALFGIEAWLRQGEVFALVLSLFGRFGPFTGQRDETGRPYLIVRSYGAGLASHALPSVSMTALVITVLATVSFDGFSETSVWAQFSGLGIGVLYKTGIVGVVGYVAAQTLVKTAGLLVAPLAFIALYLAACRISAWIGGMDTSETARRFVLSLTPIAIGYHLAHYFSYLVIQGQMIVPLASDPFGFGWDLFGTADRPLDIDAVDMRLVWIVAVGGVVFGHAAAVLLAHRAALAASIRLGAQMPLVVLMVGYTVTSLWILSQPIVAH